MTTQMRAKLKLIAKQHLKRPSAVISVLYSKYEKLQIELRLHMINHWQILVLKHIFLTFYKASVPPEFTLQNHHHLNNRTLLKSLPTINHGLHYKILHRTLTTT